MILVRIVTREPERNTKIKSAAHACVSLSRIEYKDEMIGCNNMQVVFEYLGVSDKQDTKLKHHIHNDDEENKLHVPPLFQLSMKKSWAAILIWQQQSKSSTIHI